MAANSRNPNRAPWMEDIDSKARKRAERLVNARGITQTDDTYEEEIQKETDRLRDSLLKKHYTTNPEDEGKYIVRNQIPESSAEQSQSTQPRRSENILSDNVDIPPPPVIPPASFPATSSPTGLLVIQVRSQRIQTERTREAYMRTSEYRNTIRDAGNFQYTPAELRELQEAYPDIDFSGDNVAAAAQVSLLGVNAKRLERKALDSKIISEEEKDYVVNLSRIVAIIYKENPELEQDLVEVNGAPQVTITRVPPPTVPLPDNSGTVVFNQIGEKAFRPLVGRGKAIAKAKAKDATKKLIKKGVKEAVKKTASTSAAEAGAAVGSGIFPVIGTALGAIAGWLVGTVAAGAIEAISKRAEDLRDLAGGILVAGGQAAAWVVGILWAATIGIGQAFVITLISIPVIVGFILLIINNSAWVTPPWQGAGYTGFDDDDVIDSAFIEVDKSVSPESVGNDALPVTATYTITIEAELSALTNIQFEDTCSSIKAGTPPTNPGCPPPTNITIDGVSTSTFPPTPPTTINPGSPVTITYQRVFAASLFSDTRTTDTFTVTADAEGVVGEVSAATAVLLIGNPPGPGNCADFGPDITNSFAGRIPNGNVKLLPLDQRTEDECIVPTILAMHWSAGVNDNPDGNDRTWETLDGNGFSCQFGTDTNDAQIWQALYQGGVERSRCVGGQSPSGEWWNDLTVSIEMAGVWFTDTPPPPNLEQLELTYQTSCAIMDQWGIPWHQVRGHYQMTPGKSDPGDEFFENVFLPGIRERCP